MVIEAKPHLAPISRTPTNSEPSRLGKVRLDRNDRTEPFSPAFMDRIRQRLSDEIIMAYPECWPVFLKTASHIGVPVDQILLHMGSEQAIKLIFETYISPGDKVLLHLPGYAMYPVFSKLYQADVESQCYTPDLGFDWVEYVERIKPGLRMVVVENPNGLIGHPIPMDILRRLLDRSLECGAFVVVDEAYHLFHADSAVAMLKEYDNLIITRSFSKAFGLAGMRAGCLVSRPENIANLFKLKPACELTSVTAMVLEEMLETPSEYQGFAQRTRENMLAFKNRIKAMGFQTSESVANFMTIRIGEELCELWRADLAKEGILIRRPFRETYLRDWVRISTGSAEVLQHITDVLRRILDERKDLRASTGLMGDPKRER